MLKFKTILDGNFVIVPGKFADYRTLERFHYAPGKPATFAGIWSVIYQTRRKNRPSARRLAAVGMLSYPCNSLHLREIALNLPHVRNANLRFVNENIRTISRVIVHPQFRSLGLSRRLIQCICQNCPTRYVEALAKMGRVHPLFETAGMSRYEPDSPDKPVYYLFDRLAGRNMNG